MLTEERLKEIETKAMQNDPEVYGPICRDLVAEVRRLNEKVKGLVKENYELKEGGYYW